MDVIIGKYDREVTILKPTEVEDTNSGEVSSTYASDGTYPCYLNDRMNNEQFSSIQHRDDVKRITLDVRYKEVDTAINTKWQVEFESKIYSITETFEAPEFGRKKVRRIRAEAKI